MVVAFFVVLFHHQMGSLQASKFFVFVSLLGGQVTTNVLEKIVPNDSGGPAKTGATKMQIVEAQELLPHHSQSSSDGILSRWTNPKLGDLDGETGVRCGRTDFVKTAFHGNVGRDILAIHLWGCVCAVWMQDYLNLIPSQNYRNAFNAFIQDNERTDGCFSKIIYRNHWIWRKPSYFRLSSKQMATIAPSYFTTQDVWRIDVDIAQRSLPKYRSTSTFQHRNGCFSMFNKWLHLRDVGNFLGNIHVTFSNPPKKNHNPKMNIKIVHQTTPPPTHRRGDPGTICDTRYTSAIHKPTSHAWTGCHGLKGNGVSDKKANGPFMW